MIGNKLSEQNILLNTKVINLNLDVSNHKEVEKKIGLVSSYTKFPLIFCMNEPLNYDKHTLLDGKKACKQTN